MGVATQTNMEEALVTPEKSSRCSQDLKTDFTLPWIASFNADT